MTNADILADITERLRAALGDNIEGMERERIERLADHRDALAARLTAMVAWLEKHQPDVFRRGLWDAINEADKATHEGKDCR